MPEPLRVATLPPVPPAPPWSADRPLHGSVILPDDRGAHRLDQLVAELTTSFRGSLADIGLCDGRVRRIAVSRITADAALALSAAARRLALPLVWLNDRWNASESARGLRACDAGIVITGEATPPLFVPVGLPVVRLQPLPSTAVVVLRRGALPSPVPAKAHCADEAIFFTSGTGGHPRGARLPHSAMDVQAREKVARLPFQPGAGYLHLAPHFHVGGASSALAALRAGCDHVFPPPGSLLERAPDLLRLVDDRSVTVLVVVPGVLRALADAANERRRPCPSVRAVLSGGGRAGEELRATAETAFPSARIISAYGLTEAASSVAFTEGSGAYAPAHVELGVLASSPGTRGPVVTRGPHVMRGYCGSPALAAGAWLETGDIGSVDASGALMLAGRARDVIRTGGESVFASEVEKALDAHPAVAESAVVGVPHALLGEAVAAAIVARPSGKPPLGLAEWCRARLSAYKVPKWIFQVDGLPTNALGKVVKPRLKVQLELRLSVQGKDDAVVRAKL